MTDRLRTADRTERNTQGFHPLGFVPEMKSTALQDQNLFVLTTMKQLQVFMIKIREI